jgi:hypothetical protein
MKFLHPDNQGKLWVDWRLPENRKEMFFRWFNWRLEGKNIDHYMWNLAYMKTAKSPTGKPMTRKEKLWYSYLFGTTYQSSMAWTFYWHFPDPTKVSMTELDKWNRETMPLQKFATDTRYNKGHVVKMWKSFLDWVEKRGHGDVEAAFDWALVDDETESFHRMTEEIRSLHKFGRMTGWLFAQCLYECADLPIKPDTMYTDDPGNVSVWNGTCYFQAREHMTVGKPPKFAGYKPTPQDRASFKSFEQELMAQARDKIADQTFLSYFTLETHLCQFKKLNVGFDYPGQNVGDAVNRYHELKALWPNVDYSAMAEAIDGPDMFEKIRWHRESKALMHLFHSTGQPINMDNLYPDLPDMAKEMAVSPDLLLEEGNEGVIRGKIDTYEQALTGDWLAENILTGSYRT